MVAAEFPDTTLDVGEIDTVTVGYTPQAGDPDPITNTVTASGTGADSGVEASDEASCETDILHPTIDVEKQCTELAHVGDTVTYTITVTNTGDTTLYDISVDDDILGHIGDIEVLEPGQSVTLTKDFVVGDTPVTNVGTATGEDILGHSVSADDDATVTPIADVTPPPTPFTGSDAGRLGLISIVLFGIGVTVVATTRRRRPEREAA